jgi:hypothetical protein
MNAISTGIINSIVSDTRDFELRATNIYDAIIYARGLAAFAGLTLDNSCDVGECRAYSPHENDQAEIVVRVRDGRLVFSGWDSNGKELS